VEVGKITVTVDWSQLDRAEVLIALLNEVASFVSDNKITCAEAIYQNDRVIANAYGFIERLCNITGYHKDDDAND